MDGIPIEPGTWINVLLTNSWQVAVLAGCVWLLTRRLASNRPHLAHALWALVLIKCLVPPIWCSPVGPFSWLSSVIAPAERPRISIPQPTPQTEPLVFEFEADHSLDPAEAPMIGPEDEKQSSAKTVFARLGERSFWGLLWCFGGMLFATRSVIQLCLLVARVHRHKVETPAELTALVSRLSKRLGLRTNVRVWVVGCGIGPAVLGLMRPVILLPKCIIDGKTPRELEPLIAHELVHVLRSDLFWAMAQTLATSVQWFNPFAWLASSALTRETERRCDEDTVIRLGIAPADYARALIDVLEKKHQLQVASALPGVRPVEITANRLERVMSLRQGSQISGSRLAAWVTVVGCLIVLPGARLAAQGDRVSANSDATQSESDPPLPKVVSKTLPPAKALSWQPNENTQRLIIKAQMWEVPEREANRLMAKWAESNSKDPSIVAKLTDQLLQEAERELQQCKAATPVSRPHLSTLTGKEARCMIGKQRPFVVAHKRVESTDKESKVVAYQPKVEVINEGLVLNLTANKIPHATKDAEANLYRLNYRFERTKLIKVDEFKMTVGEGDNQSERSIQLPFTKNLSMESTFQVEDGQSLAINNGTYEKDGRSFVTLTLLTLDEANPKAAQAALKSGKSFVRVGGRLDDDERKKAAAALEALDIQFDFKDGFRVAPKDAYIANAFVEYAAGRRKFVKPATPLLMFDPRATLRLGQVTVTFDKVISREQKGSTMTVLVANAEIEGSEFTFRAKSVALDFERGALPHDLKFVEIRFERQAEIESRNGLGKQYRISGMRIRQDGVGFGSRK